MSEADSLGTVITGSDVNRRMVKRIRTYRVPWRASTQKPGGSWGGIGLFGVVGFAAPALFFGESDYGYSFLLSIVIWTGLAISWNAFSGLTGYFSLGHAAFFGVGAYTVAILYPLLGAWPALIAASIVAGLFGFLLGFVSLRLRGLFFTMATIGIAEVLRLGIMLTPNWSGGATGLTLGKLPLYSTTYKMSLGILLLFIALQLIIMSSVHGRRLIAIRDDEDALNAVGVAVSRYKVLSFSLSVMAAGFFGGIYTLQLGYVQPDAVFPLLMSLTVVIMCLFGGIGTLWGPVLGALLLSLMREQLWFKYPTLWDLALGVLLVMIVLVMPGGFIGFLRRVVPALRKHLL